MFRFLTATALVVSFVACRAAEPNIPNPVVEELNVSAALAKPELIAELPENVRTAINDCRTAKKFYDLRTLTCVDAAFPSFACELDGKFKARLSQVAKDEIDSYLKTIDPVLRLYDCTVENSLVLVHFYKFEEQRIKYSILKLSPG